MRRRAEKFARTTDRCYHTQNQTAFIFRFPFFAHIIEAKKPIYFIFCFSMSKPLMQTTNYKNLAQSYLKITSSPSG